MVREYIEPDDFHQLIEKILENYPKEHMHIDAYTNQQVSKFPLLYAIEKRFGLDWDIRGSVSGGKLSYYSSNRFNTVGYEPSKTSLETIMSELELL